MFHDVVSGVSGFSCRIVGLTVWVGAGVLVGVLLRVVCEQGWIREGGF